MNALSIKGLNKSFGKVNVIDNLSLEVPQNCVYGFLGQNGAGKTTTMKMILGLLKADGGEISVFGQKVTFGKTNSLIGYLPDVPEFYGFMTCSEYLNLCGSISCIKKAKIKQRSKELLKLVGLDNTKSRISGFSRGMKQRLGIAQALLNEPKLLICDEPTSALDPIGRKEILDILKKVKNNTTVIFSTHVLSDVEKICDRVGILNKGNIVLQGNLNDIKLKNVKHKCYVELLNKDNMRELLLDNNLRSYVIEKNEDNLSVIFDSKVNGSLIDLFSQKKIIPSKFEIVEPSLEDIFQEVVR